MVPKGRTPPRGIGAALRGWDVPEDRLRDPSRMPVVDFRAMTSSCKWDCPHCFTDKRRRTLGLERILSVIDELADMGTYAIDYLGEGEPTLDRDFFRIVERTSARGIVPVVFTDGATRLRDRAFVRRLYDSGASVCPKCDSLFDPAYQNLMVGDRRGKYSRERDEAIGLLMEEGFNKAEEDGTTRMGFDMVLSSRNIHQVGRTLRFCRENNLWVVFSFFLPSGRSARPDFDKSLTISPDEAAALGTLVRAIDAGYGFHHETLNNFLTHRCVERMCIYGDGSVSPCVGNETVIGNVGSETLASLNMRIIERFPCHDPRISEGYCCYRPRIGQKGQ